jgi:hypothetical protein
VESPQGLSIADIYQFLGSHLIVEEVCLYDGRAAFLHLMPGEVEIWKIACRVGKLELFVQHLFPWLGGIGGDVDDLIVLMEILCSEFDIATKQGKCIMPNKYNSTSELMKRKQTKMVFFGYMGLSWENVKQEEITVL